MGPYSFELFLLFLEQIFFYKIIGRRGWYDIWFSFYYSFTTSPKLSVSAFRKTELYILPTSSTYHFVEKSLLYKGENFASALFSRGSIYFTKNYFQSRYMPTCNFRVGFAHSDRKSWRHL
jgi:hypothetical protein